MRIPQFPEILAMARSHGRDSAWPEGWQNLAAMWPLGYGGLNARDVSGNGYDMTAGDGEGNNEPTRSVGKLGPCLDLALANSEYLSIDKAVVIGYPITMIAWGKSTDLTNSQIVLWVGDKDTEDKMAAFLSFAGNTDDKVRMASYFGGASESAYSSTVYTSGKWHHLAGVITTTDHYAWIDGGSKGSCGSGPNDLSPPSDRTAIGMAMDSSSTSPLDGSVAFPTIWSRALSAEEVRYHYERGWWEMVTERPLAISMYGKAPAAGEPSAEHRRRMWMHYQRMRRAG